MGVRHINPDGMHRSPAFSQAVVVEQPAKTIYIGGQNGVGADGKVVGPTLRDQSVQAFRNLATILESEGGEPVEHRPLDHRSGRRPVRRARAWPRSNRCGTQPTRRRPSPCTSSPLWVPTSSSRSTLSPLRDAPAAAVAPVPAGSEAR